MSYIFMTELLIGCQLLPRVTTPRLDKMIFQTKEYRHGHKDYYLMIQPSMRVRQTAVVSAAGRIPFSSPSPPPCESIQPMQVALPPFAHLCVVNFPHEGHRPVLDPSKPCVRFQCGLTQLFRFSSTLHPSHQTFPSTSGPRF